MPIHVYIHMPRRLRARVPWPCPAQPSPSHPIYKYICIHTYIHIHIFVHTPTHTHTHNCSGGGWRMEKWPGDQDCVSVLPQVSPRYAVCGSVLQCIAVSCGVLHYVYIYTSI